MQDNKKDLCAMRIRNILKLVKLLLALICLASAANVYATVKNEAVFTYPNQPIEINLTNSISGIANPVVTIVAPGPAHGTTAACAVASPVCVTYTPATDYAGTDVFDYSVVNDTGGTETATITVTVGSSSVQNDGVVPSIEVGGTWAEICAASPTDPQLINLCNDYNNAVATAGANQEDLRILLEPISPADIAARGTLGNILAEEQLANVGKHLAALRRGQRMASVGGLAFNSGDKTISGNMLAELIEGESRGGAASANSVSGGWGWFVNGNLGGGKQDETPFENGFEFNSNGISVGLDYRFGFSGVLGIAVGLAATNMDLNHALGGLEAKGSSVIVYSSLYPTQDSYVDIIVSNNVTGFDAERRITFGTSDEYAFSSNDSQATALRLAAGFDLVNRGGLSASMDAKTEYIQSTIDGYSETGLSPYKVTIAEREVTQLSVSVGSTVSYAISTPRAVWVPQLDLFWVHQFEDEADVIEGYFQVDPNQTIFRFNSNLPDTDYFKLDLGVSMLTPGGMTAFAQVGSTLARSDYQNWRLAGGLRIEF